MCEIFLIANRPQRTVRGEEAHRVTVAATVRVAVVIAGVELGGPPAAVTPVIAGVELGGRPAAVTPRT